MDLTTIFYYADEFCKQYKKYAQEKCLPDFGEIQRKRLSRMTLSEIISVFIYYAMPSHEFKTFKAFYKYAKPELESAFLGLVSYERITESGQTHLNSLKYNTFYFIGFFFLYFLQKEEGSSFCKPPLCELKMQPAPRFTRLGHPFACQ